MSWMALPHVGIAQAVGPFSQRRRDIEMQSTEQSDQMASNGETQIGGVGGPHNTPSNASCHKLPLGKAKASHCHCHCHPGLGPAIGQQGDCALGGTN